MDKDSVKIAVLSDFHYSLEPNTACPERRGEYLPAILAAMVKKLNCEVKPDLVLIGGDLINFPDAPEAERLTAIIAEILSLLDMPYTVIRGNHDLEQEKFVKFFPFKKVTDIKFVRIVAFDDAETPGYNAVRSEADLKAMAEFADWDGIKLSFQHTPLLPQGKCIYNYDNAEEIFEVMLKNNYCGAISGHYHEGIKLFSADKLQFFVQNALCESPFGATLLEISREGIISADEIIPPCRGMHATVVRR